MEKIAIQQPLSNLQLEFLKLFSQTVSDDDLLEIKKLVSSYFAEKAMDAADKVWEEKGWTNEDMERLANTRMRTAYNSNNE
ncbi:MAG: hypothetical protein K9H64_10680 [Bacteroidales bacterium]|nr:hypothetical protein [Bacteroidales bacterium]MCF8456299.1 hypothetical protein [Bacteroidales bacterium]